MLIRTKLINGLESACRFIPITSLIFLSSLSTCSASRSSSLDGYLSSSFCNVHFTILTWRHSSSTTIQARGQLKSRPFDLSSQSHVRYRCKIVVSLSTEAIFTTTRLGLDLDKSRYNILVLESRSALRCTVPLHRLDNFLELSFQLVKSTNLHESFRSCHRDLHCDKTATCQCCCRIWCRKIILRNRLIRHEFDQSLRCSKLKAVALLVSSKESKHGCLW